MEMKRLSAKSSLVGIIPSMLLVNAVLSCASIYSMSKIEANNDEVIEHWLPGVELSKETDRRILDTIAASSLTIEVAKLRDLTVDFKLDGSLSLPRAAAPIDQSVVSPARILRKKAASTFSGKKPAAVLPGTG